jgi:hypothetical protein
MQGKKLSVLVIIVVVLVVGWYLSMKKVSGVDDRKAQEILVEQADMYASKQLYVRAIPLYEEALGYNTDENITIQDKLLAVYEKYEDTASYISLAEKRMETGNAKAEEYLNVASYYYQRSNIEESMDVIKHGIAKYGTSELETFYEENRYANYNVKTTGYEKIIPTLNNTYMPAFDGEKWVYIDSDGRTKKTGEFDTVVPFNADGYAVVSENGKYKTILLNGDLYGIDETGIEDVYYMTSSGFIGKCNGKYGYYNYDFEKTSSLEFDAITCSRNSLIAVKTGDYWGIINSSGETVVDFTLLDVAINSLGSAYYGNHAMVETNNGWHLIDASGNDIGANIYSDAKAPESANGYIAVADEKGKWGFIDINGNQVIDYKYDDAKSFSDGLAAVCLGDRWEYIDDKGSVIIDISMDDAEPFHKGIAQVDMTEGASLIILKYYEE